MFDRAHIAWLPAPSPCAYSRSSQLNADTLLLITGNFTKLFILRQAPETDLSDKT